MIKLSTPVTIKKSAELNWDSTIVSIGSCFSERFVKHLASLNVGTASNPSGIVYNAASIYHIVKHIANQKTFTEQDFFEHNGKWQSWIHHGSFSSTELETALKIANQAAENFRSKLQQANTIILTPSSSVVYIHNDIITANCHRVPNNQFAEKILSVEENFNYLQQTVDAIQKINPDCKVVLTLSPVRHYPGDLQKNSVSKANLRAAIYQLQAKGNVNYFPSYEILLDELRDYRFYKKDMLHPNELAEEIIFQRFIENYFTKEATNALPARIKQLKQENHRPRQ